LLLGKSTPAIRAKTLLLIYNAVHNNDRKSALTLFMFFILAADPNNALAFMDFAVTAHFFNR
jgi:hypothetical protein